MRMTIWNSRSVASGRTKTDRILLLMHFDLVDLRLFPHVAEAASITHGATKANMALTSASERVRGMERAAEDRFPITSSSAGRMESGVEFLDEFLQLLC